MQVTVTFLKTLYDSAMELVRAGDAQLPLRQRNKLQTKRLIQGTALELLADHSYESVTIEEIAASARVSPSTIYRHFGTKEGVFLWDEYDHAVLAEFGVLLEDHGPIDAMMKALDQVLTSRFKVDKDRAMAQLQLLDEVAELRHAMVGRLDDLRRDLARMVVETGWPSLQAHVFAGALVSSFQAVLELWREGNGDRSLLTMFDEAVLLLARGFDAKEGALAPAEVSQPR